MKDQVEWFTPMPPLVVPQIIIIARFHQIIISCHWNKWTLADLAPADKYRSTLRSLIMQYSLYYLHVSARSDIYRSSADQVWFIQFPVWALDHNWEAQLHSWTVAVKHRKIQKRRCVSNNSVTLVGCDRSRSRSVIDPSARWCCIGLWRDRIITSYHSYHWGFYCYHWGYQRNHYNTNHHFIASRLLHPLPSSEEYNKISFWFIFLCKSLEKPPTS